MRVAIAVLVMMGLAGCGRREPATPLVFGANKGTVILVCPEGTRLSKDNDVYVCTTNSRNPSAGRWGRGD